ncbi:V-type proton ATPase 16 kDa proteolipid subunit [Tyrophagus putrescentiae]|nr:V-type proton ATPase 16 kDa proteolipid subunit [Tyrophagus putrescentiae]
MSPTRSDCVRQRTSITPSTSSPPAVDLKPIYGPFFGVLGCSFAMIFSSLGAAYGTANQSSPWSWPGIIAIYGLVVSALIANQIGPGGVEGTYSLFKSALHLGAGLSVGLSGLAAGYAIGLVGDAGVRGTAQQPRLFVGMILILIFAEVLGLYGLIVALVLTTKSG